MSDGSPFLFVRLFRSFTLIYLYIFSIIYQTQAKDAVRHPQFGVSAVNSLEYQNEKMDALVYSAVNHGPSEVTNQLLSMQINPLERRLKSYVEKHPSAFGFLQPYLAIERQLRAVKDKPALRAELAEQGLAEYENQFMLLQHSLEAHIHLGHIARVADRLRQLDLQFSPYPDWQLVSLRVRVAVSDFGGIESANANIVELGWQWEKLYKRIEPIVLAQVSPESLRLSKELILHWSQTKPGRFREGYRIYVSDVNQLTDKDLAQLLIKQMQHSDSVEEQLFANAAENHLSKIQSAQQKSESNQAIMALEEYIKFLQTDNPRPLFIYYEHICGLIYSMCQSFNDYELLPAEKLKLFKFGYNLYPDYFTYERSISVLKLSDQLNDHIAWYVFFRNAFYRTPSYLNDIVPEQQLGYVMQLYQAKVSEIFKKIKSCSLESDYMVRFDHVDILLDHFFDEKINLKIRTAISDVIESELMIIRRLGLNTRAVQSNGRSYKAPELLSIFRRLRSQASYEQNTFLLSILLAFTAAIALVYKLLPRLLAIKDWFEKKSTPASSKADSPKRNRKKKSTKPSTVSVVQDSFVSPSLILKEVTVVNVELELPLVVSHMDTQVEITEIMIQKAKDSYLKKYSLGQDVSIEIMKRVDNYSIKLMNLTEENKAFVNGDFTASMLQLMSDHLEEQSISQLKSTSFDRLTQASNKLDVSIQTAVRWQERIKTEMQDFSQHNDHPHINEFLAQLQNNIAVMQKMSDQAQQLTDRFQNIKIKRIVSLSGDVDSLSQQVDCYAECIEKLGNQYNDFYHIKLMLPSVDYQLTDQILQQCCERFAKEYLSNNMICSFSIVEDQVLISIKLANITQYQKLPDNMQQCFMKCVTDKLEAMHRYTIKQLTIKLNSNILEIEKKMKKITLRRDMLNCDTLLQEQKEKLLNINRRSQEITKQLAGKSIKELIDLQEECNDLLSSLANLLNSIRDHLANLNRLSTQSDSGCGVINSPQDELSKQLFRMISETPVKTFSCPEETSGTLVSVFRFRGGVFDEGLQDDDNCDNISQICDQ